MKPLVTDKTGNIVYKGKNPPNKKIIKALLIIFSILTFTCPFVGVIWASFFERSNVFIEHIIIFASLTVVLISTTICFILMRIATKINCVFYDFWITTDEIQLHTHDNDEDNTVSIENYTQPKLFQLRVFLIMLLYSVSFICFGVFITLCLWLDDYFIGFNIGAWIAFSLGVIITTVIRVKNVTAFVCSKRDNYFSSDFNILKFSLITSAIYCFTLCCDYIQTRNAGIIISIVGTLIICGLGIREMYLPYKQIEKSVIYEGLLLTFNNELCLYYDGIGWFVRSLSVSACLTFSPKVTLHRTYPYENGGDNSRIPSVIDKDAFYGHYELTNITIPDTTEIIKTGAFADCENLTDITYQGTMEKWKSIEKYELWNYNTGEYTIHCTDGDLNKNEEPINDNNHI